MGLFFLCVSLVIQILTGMSDNVITFLKCFLNVYIFNILTQVKNDILQFGHFMTLMFTCASVWYSGFQCRVHAVNMWEAHSNEAAQRELLVFRWKM